PRHRRLRQRAASDDAGVRGPADGAAEGDGAAFDIAGSAVPHPGSRRRPRPAMTDLAPYADVELLLVATFGDFGDVGTVLPSDMHDKLPLVRTRRIGGTDNGVSDDARVVIDVFAVSRAAAWDVALAVQQLMISVRRRVAGVGISDRATTNVGSQDAPYEVSRVRLVTAIYD